MKTLSNVSVISVLCAVSIWLFVAPQLLIGGVIELRAPVELMVVLPTLVGLVCALVGVLAGAPGLVRRSDARSAPRIVMTFGQLSTVTLAVVIVVWSQTHRSTGWELLALPASLMFGQIAVAAGLILAIARRRRRAGYGDDPSRPAHSDR